MLPGRTAGADPRTAATFAGYQPGLLDGWYFKLIFSFLRAA